MKYYKKKLNVTPKIEKPMKSTTKFQRKLPNPRKFIKNPVSCFPSSNARYLIFLIKVKINCENQKTSE